MTLRRLSINTSTLTRITTLNKQQHICSKSRPRESTRNQRQHARSARMTSWRRIVKRGKNHGPQRRRDIQPVAKPPQTPAKRKERRWRRRNQNFIRRIRLGEKATNRWRWQRERDIHRRDRSSQRTNRQTIFKRKGFNSVIRGAGRWGSSRSGRREGGSAGLSFPGVCRIWKWKELR